MILHSWTIVTMTWQTLLKCFGNSSYLTKVLGRRIDSNYPHFQSQIAKFSHCLTQMLHVEIIDLHCVQTGLHSWRNVGNYVLHGGMWVTPVILLMAEIPNNHLGCMKPYKQWDKLPTSTGAGFQPSTVGFLRGGWWFPLIFDLRFPKLPKNKNPLGP